MVRMYHSRRSRFYCYGTSRHACGYTSGLSEIGATGCGGIEGEGTKYVTDKQRGGDKAPLARLIAGGGERVAPPRSPANAGKSNTG